MNLKRTNKSMKNFLKNNWFKLVIALVVVLIGFSVVWYFIITPHLNRKKLDKCLDESHEKYDNEWKEYCVLDGREIGTDGSCLLDSERADYLNEYFKDKKNECFKKYPIK